MSDAPLDREVLAKIGTQALIASDCSDLCIRQWRRRGIPWKERRRVQKIAVERGVDLPPDFLDVQRPDPKDDRKTKPKRRKVRNAAQQASAA